MDSKIVVVCIVVSAVAIAIRLLLPRILAWRGVWFTWRTRFGPALVFDSTDQDGTTVRLLNVNGTYQSVCYVDEDLRWYPVCEYHRSWADVVERTWGKADKGAPATRRALVMGGGGYSFPKWLVAFRPDFTCEAVEIDPKVTQIARERFFVDDLVGEFRTSETGRLTLVCDDAWSYLDADEDGFDLIINDAFRGNRPMGPLDVGEGARKVRAHLRPGGVYIGNVRTPLEGRKGSVLIGAQKAFSQEFLHVQTIPERPEEPRKVGNNALVAWGEKGESPSVEKDGASGWQTS